ncbi:hypothetical protein RvY_10070 [Ramazzottius varieornatus]|uniref:Nuclear receptor domain-containing protein n=1 Tax=Ramazzottius varieornatus TaxID=947166 RepID=A0A1D1VKJ4_RAMVA|nr:hypothetical protein RvY_10070 [Ramazzottius varieornatus]
MEMENGMPIPRGRGFTPFPFGRCQVCAAEATGNHYGANTCEGCKGFFKRSLPVFRTFRCFFGNKCDVGPDTRNRCKACRFRKCVEAGMALDAVKMGRIPKAVKEQALVTGKKSRGRDKQASNGASTSTTNTDEVASSPGSDAGSLQSGSTDTAMTTSIDEFRGAFEKSLEKQAQQQQQQQARYVGGGKDVPSTSPLQSGAYRFHPYNTEVKHSHQPAFKASERLHSSLDETSRQMSLAQSQYRSIGDNVGGYQQHQQPVTTGALTETATEIEAGRHTWQSTSCQLSHDDQTQTMSSHSQTPHKGQSDQQGTSSKRSDENSHNTFTSSNGWMLQMPFARAAESGAGINPKKNCRILTLADMAITGDVNENIPDMQLPTEDQMKAVMANSKTAVAVMNPALRGGHQSMPVVPSDVLVFRPTYVRDDQIPVSSAGRIGYGVPSALAPAGGFSGCRDLYSLARSLVAQFQAGIPIPGHVMIDFYSMYPTDSRLKASMCEFTKCMVARGNEEIYGEETRANEVFMNEAMSSGKIPKTCVPERTPQEMRDVLKDRLITQVKRVVLLSESSILGFRSLSIDDQHSLLRTSILDVWMVHSSRFLRDEKSYIIFHETKTFYSREWMEMFLTDEFLITVFEMAAKINALQLSFEELALLKTILIVRPDRPGLVNVEFITLIHNHLLDALKVTISQRRPDESEQLLGKLLELLKGWRILDVMQERYVHPIDLSQLSKGPWKVDNQRSHSASPATSAKEKLTIDEANNGGVDGKMVSARLSSASVNGKE